MGDQIDNKSAHIFNLAKELLDDIELSRLPAEPLLLKAIRLARLVGDDKIQSWLRFEMLGYNSGDTTAIEFMGATGRWTDYDKKLGYYGPLAQQDALIEALKTEQNSIRMPDLSGNYIVMTAHAVIDRANAISQEIGRLSSIKSRVTGLLHQFVASVFYEKAFSDLAESIFESYKTDVDLRITHICKDVLEKLPYVYDRLREKDQESVSQGLNTCRRIINAFADSIFPPRDGTYKLGENELNLGPNFQQNRINVFIAERVQSQSRRKRLRQTLSNLYDRVSTGIHDDVTPDEAQALLLSTYLFLGELLTLPAPK